MRVPGMFVGVGLVVMLAIAAPATSVGANDGDRCTKREARRIVEQFVTSHNRGDVQKLDRLFAKRRFLFYMVNPSERPSPEAEDRDTLVNYFRERKGYRDRIVIESLNIGRNPNYSGWGIGFVLRRSSSDPNPLSSGRFAGKGLVNCHKIRGWRMGWDGP